MLLGTLIYFGINKSYSTLLYPSLSQAHDKTPRGTPATVFGPLFETHIDNISKMYSFSPVLLKGTKSIYFGDVVIICIFKVNVGLACRLSYFYHSIIVQTEWLLP